MVSFHIAVLIFPTSTIRLCFRVGKAWPKEEVIKFWGKPGLYSGYKNNPKFSVSFH